MLSKLRWLNPALELFDLRIVEIRMGWWRVVDGKITRTTYHLGWRLRSREHWEGVPDGATEMDRFILTKLK